MKQGERQTQAACQPSNEVVQSKQKGEQAAERRRAIKPMKQVNKNDQDDCQVSQSTSAELTTTDTSKKSEQSTQLQKRPIPVSTDETENIDKQAEKTKEQEHQQQGKSSTNGRSKQTSGTAQEQSLTAQSGQPESEVKPTQMSMNKNQQNGDPRDQSVESQAQKKIKNNSKQEGKEPRGDLPSDAQLQGKWTDTRAKSTTTDLLAAQNAVDDGKRQYKVGQSPPPQISNTKVLKSGSEQQVTLPSTIKQDKTLPNTKSQTKQSGIAKNQLSIPEAQRQVNGSGPIEHHDQVDASDSLSKKAVRRSYSLVSIQTAASNGDIQEPEDSSSALNDSARCFDKGSQKIGPREHSFSFNVLESDRKDNKQPTQVVKAFAVTIHPVETPCQSVPFVKSVHRIARAEQLHKEMTHQKQLQAQMTAQTHPNQQMAAGQSASQATETCYESQVNQKNAREKAGYSKEQLGNNHFPQQETRTQHVDTNISEKKPTQVPVQIGLDDMGKTAQMNNNELNKGEGHKQGAAKTNRKTGASKQKNSAQQPHNKSKTNDAARVAAGERQEMLLQGAVSQDRASRNDVAVQSPDDPMEDITNEDISQGQMVPRPVILGGNRNTGNRARQGSAGATSSVTKDQLSKNSLLTRASSRGREPQLCPQTNMMVKLSNPKATDQAQLDVVMSNENQQGIRVTTSLCKDLQYYLNRLLHRSKGKADGRFYHQLQDDYKELDKFLTVLTKENTGYAAKIGGVSERLKRIQNCVEKMSTALKAIEPLPQKH